MTQPARRLGRSLLLLISLLLTGGAVGPYQKEADYLTSLRSPLRPTVTQCSALRSSFDREINRLIQNHDQCLSKPGTEPSGRTCSRLSCQPIHDLRDYAEKRAASENEICSQRLRMAQAEIREQEEFARTAREEYERQMREAVQGTVRPNISSNPMNPAPPNRVDPQAKFFTQRQFDTIREGRAKYETECKSSWNSQGAIWSQCQALRAWLEEYEPLATAANATGNSAWAGPTIGPWNGQGKPWPYTGNQVPRDPIETYRTIINELTLAIVTARSKPKLKHPGQNDFGEGHYKRGCTITNALGIEACGEYRSKAQVEHDTLISEANRQQNEGCAILDNADTRRQFAQKHAERFLQLLYSCKRK